MAFQSQGIGSPEGQTPDQEADQANLSEVVSVVEEPSPLKSETTSAPGFSLVGNERPLTKAHGIQALVEFRESLIRTEIPTGCTPWILRDAMIETFVSQHFTDPDQWLRKFKPFFGRPPIQTRRISILNEFARSLAALTQRRMHKHLRLRLTTLDLRRRDDKRRPFRYNCRSVIASDPSNHSK